MGAKLPQGPPCKSCGTLPKAGDDLRCYVCNPKQESWMSMFWKRWMRCDDAKDVEIERLNNLVGDMSLSRDFYAERSENNKKLYDEEREYSLSLSKKLDACENDRQALQAKLESIASLCRSERIQTSNDVFDSGKYGE